MRKTENDKVLYRKPLLAPMNIILSLGALWLLFLCAFHSTIIDKLFLLEETHPAYWYWLKDSESKIIEVDDAIIAPYVLTYVKKEGFGGVTEGDLLIFLNSVKSQYPQATHVFLRFEDDTAIDIPLRSLDNPIMGRITDEGDFEYEKTVDFSVSLAGQIDGLSTIRYDFDENRNPIHEIHLDVEGNAIEDANGVAEYFREYDDQGNIVWEKCLDSEGQPVLNEFGTAEIRRVYDGNNVINESYYDENGEPTLCNKGYAAVVSEFDNENRIIEQRYYDIDGQLHQFYAGYNAIAQKWDNNTLIERTYLGTDGNPIVRTDGFAKVVWEQNEGIRNVHFYDLEDREIDLLGLNLVTNVDYGSDGWSGWMKPKYDTSNSCFNIGFVNLGNDVEGDVYTCSVEIEYRDVHSTKGQEFLFWTQGAQDGEWTTGNIWDPSLVYLSTVPENGICTYTSTRKITEDMTHISRFNIGFRCNYWASGSFRVRNVKIEKGDTATEWTPGL